jgi:hypothetical protein
MAFGLNNLKLNIQKTKHMFITFKQNVPVEVNIVGNELELVDDMKYLGSIIDDKLKFGKNVQHIEKKTIAIRSISSEDLAIN